MKNAVPRIPKEYVVPLNMNGLRGRLLRMPAARKNKKREILLVYGHHACLERMKGIVDVLADYGNVAMPDLPGFGGMDSFYKIGEKPSLDNLADYLASVVKLRYRGRRFTVVGFSFGFLVVTRMLQRYPDIANKVDLVVSLTGYAHHEDFVFSRRRKRMYRIGSRVFRGRIASAIFRNIALHPSLLRTVYPRTYNAQDKFKDMSPEELALTTEFEVFLWRTNDLRTHMFTTHAMLTVNNCDIRVALPVWHVYVENDKYFDNNLVEQHLSVIFEEVNMLKASAKSHSPSIIGDKKVAGTLFPRKLRALLNKTA